MPHFCHIYIQCPPTLLYSSQGPKVETFRNLAGSRFQFESSRATLHSAHKLRFLEVTT